MTKNEFERLQTGQIIQNKKDPKWAFIVHQNFGERLTAVRTIEVRDPENWDVITKVQIEESFAPHTPEIKQAATDLFEKLKHHDWFSTVGIGNKELFVYTSKKKYPKGYTEFGGFPVNYKYMGRMAPSGGSA